MRIPPYCGPRNAWRKQLHKAILKRQQKSHVSYLKNDKLEVEVRIYMSYTALRFHDVDNRLKDVMDALQGRAGGPKKKRTLDPIIANDKQIYRVIMEKAPIPWQSHGLGHLTIRRFRQWDFVRRFPLKHSKRR
jgi:hypothetical protein